jgi:Mlc titration factor MtfA (ptsG expression regulator)
MPPSDAHSDLGDNRVVSAACRPKREPRMGILKSWRRRRLLRRTSIDEASWRSVVGGLPFLDYLDQVELARLREMSLIFLYEKEMHGAHALVLADDVRLAIALQACLPVLNLGLDVYDGWIGIVVHPGEFRVRREEIDDAGVVHEWEDELAGESWPGGPVVLSWADVRRGEAGYNVVVHEFAHKIDMLNGDADGIPIAHHGMDAKAWRSVLEESYELFCAAVERGARYSPDGGDELAPLNEQGEELPFDPYAAEHPAEFFAVMSEEFFTDPLTLRDAYPELYDQLALFYRQDPARRWDEKAVRSET